MFEISVSLLQMLLSLLILCHSVLSEYTIKYTAKGHQRAIAILRCFESRDRDLLVRAFTTYVRPLLEYNSVVWSPYLKSDTEAVEKVQQKYTRLAGLKNLTRGLRY